MDGFVSARSRGEGTQLHNTHTRAHIYICNCTHARVQGGDFHFQAKLTSLLGGSEIVYVRFSFVRTREHISKFAEYYELMFRESVAIYIQTGTVMTVIFRLADWIVLELSDLEKTPANACDDPLPIEIKCVRLR